MKQLTTETDPQKQALAMKTFLRGSLSQVSEEHRPMVEKLMKPAGREWTSGRVATLLASYFVSQLPANIQAAIAEDWLAELQSFPAWALQEACRWWLSADNPERKRKPHPGDIAARARQETLIVRLADERLNDLPKRKQAKRDTKEGRVSGATANEIVRQAGLAKRINKN